MTDTAPKILCAGIAVQDILMQVERFPAPGSKVSASNFITIGGGCAANAAVSLARLGAKALFSGPVGGADDATTDRILHDLEAEDVNCSHAVRVPGATASVSLILIDAAGEKMIATRRGAGLAAARPADADDMVRDIDALLIDNRFPDFVTPLCEAARNRGIPVVIDGDQATTADNRLLTLGSHAVFSTEGLYGTTGLSEPQAALLRMRSRLDCFLAVTDGPNGLYWLDGTKARHMPAFHVQAVDSLAAGDTFHAGFVYGVALGWPLETSLRFASAAAALKCETFGGPVGAPTRAAVEQFLKTRG